ncbi:hypothetical protein GCM10007094_41400 [Pseudovibrio japonicus]|uniref:Uncharacterized protein n=1 Tax=Pseudovibrio japonicus TaxID=366534 RepID=A0ABQ3ESG8_9HYPH|nr:hypothetical protein GCM10007094_41400 [Pseudovibrio japonicus]
MKLRSNRLILIEAKINGINLNKNTYILDTYRSCGISTKMYTPKEAAITANKIE